MHELEISKSVFRAEVVTTFGKLNEKDIEDCDALPDRLATQLVINYGWSSAYARTKADELCRKLLASSTVATEKPEILTSEK